MSRTDPRLSPPGAERPPMFRRRRFDASHRRPGWIRSILRPLTLAVIIVGLPVGAATWALQSPRFELSTVRIATGERVPMEWVAENLEPLRGRHLLLLSLAEVEGLLGDHRWIDGVEVSKKLPDALVVRILERIPAAIQRAEDGRHYVDREGRRIDRVGQIVLAGLVTIDAPVARSSAIAGAIHAIETLAARDSAMFAGIATAQLVDGTDLRVEVAGLPYDLLLRPDRLEPAVSRFLELRSRIEERFEGFSAVDLRYHRQIVMQFPEA